MNAADSPSCLTGDACDRLEVTIFMEKCELVMSRRHSDY